MYRFRFFKIEFKPQAIKDIEKIAKNEAKKILLKIEEMSDNLKGDVKHLTNFTPEYRLRVGNYRILFEIQNNEVIVIYRIVKRDKAYL